MGIQITKIILMITYSNTDESKQTLTYNEAYKLVSKILRNNCKHVSLKDLHEELKKKNITISYNLLSQIKNRRLPHEYPGLIEKLFIFFGIDDVKVDKETLFTLKKSDLETLKNL